MGTIFEGEGVGVPSRTMEASSVEGAVSGMASSNRGEGGAGHPTSISAVSSDQASLRDCVGIVSAKESRMLSRRAKRRPEGGGRLGAVYRIGAQGFLEEDVEGRGIFQIGIGVQEGLR